MRSPYTYSYLLPYSDTDNCLLLLTLYSGLRREIQTKVSFTYALLVTLKTSAPPALSFYAILQACGKHNVPHLIQRHVS